MRVATPAGEWHVRRRWAPRHLGPHTVWGRFLDRSRRVRKRTSDLGDIPDPGCAPDLGEAIAVFVLVVVFVFFMIFFGIPLLIALGELILVLVLCAAGVVVRFLFRRPWTVDAVGPDGTHHTWDVVGWKASGTARQFVADRVAAGSVPTTDEVTAAALAS